MKLVIVESPAKAQSIANYLGKGFVVKSSIGHIMHLSKTGKFHLGIDLETFEPSYSVKRDHLELVNELKKIAKKSEHVYLATDRDREGEIISFHLMKKLNIEDKYSRITFNEVTKDVVRESIKNPQKINLPMINSQQTRRMLDRIVGFRLSNLLRKKIHAPSAGRVQTVILKLIVEREKEIEKFIPSEFWTLDAEFSENITMNLSKFKGRKIEFENVSGIKKLIKGLSSEFIIKKIIEKKIHRKGPIPFITSSLQQSSHNKLGFSSKKTMFLAQRLYEGIGNFGGLITYMRTDSTRISEVFKKDVKKYITKKYGPEVLKKEDDKIVIKSNVQDAHEAIRPTNLTLPPEVIKKHLSQPEMKLYKLIFDRTIASFMNQSISLNKQIVVINNDAEFHCHSSVVQEKGFLIAYGSELKKEKDYLTINNLKENQKLVMKKFIEKQNFTAPPNRFTESTIIKICESEGVGRPSTYSIIINTLINRNYVTVIKKSFHANRLGILVVDTLEKYFPDLIDITFTRNMEKILDNIATNNFDYKEYIKEFYEYFENVIENLLETMEEIIIKLKEKCLKCDSQLILKYGRFGEFVGCVNFPDCEYTRKYYANGFIPLLLENKKCPKCLQELITRFNSRKEEVFVACTMFPYCDFVKPLEKQPEFVTNLKTKK